MKMQKDVIVLDREKIFTVIFEVIAGFALNLVTEQKQCQELIITWKSVYSL